MGSTIGSAAWRRAAALFVLALICLLALPRVAGAQSCNRNCPVAEKDAQGCCKPKPKPVPKPAAPEPKPLECREGRVATDGTCCWPKQKSIEGRCRGIPSCPTGYRTVGEDCAPLECTGGRVRPPKAPARCCFAGQDWDAAGGKCIGIPTSCPKGMEGEGEDCVSVDKDSDGVPNKDDRCPTEPEDRDGFQDGDGCIDLDNDGDRIADTADKCPNEPEDMDGFEDEDGCVDPDNDGDGIADVVDKCVSQAEDKDGVADDDGCPDGDNDGDGIADEVDPCRDAAEDKNGFEDGDGCPDEEKRRRLTADRRRKEILALREDHEASRDAAAARRIGAYVLVGAGGAGVVVMGAFLGLGAANNDSIREGGYASSSDIEAAVEEGESHNAGAIGAGVVGGVAVVGGVILLVASLDPGEFVEPTAVGSSAPRRFGLVRGERGLGLGASW